MVKEELAYTSMIKPIYHLIAAQSHCEKEWEGLI